MKISLSGRGLLRSTVVSAIGIFLSIQFAMGEKAFAATDRAELDGKTPYVAEANQNWMLLSAVQGFRDSAKLDMATAMKTYAAPSGISKFSRLNKTLWEGVDSHIGWSHFMLVSVLTIVASEKDVPLVAFYNPWSDVFLFTEWQFAKNGPRIVDAEILLGDWVRRRGEGPIRSVPLWLRGGKALPAGPAIAAADSMLALEVAFENWNGRDWRAHLGGFSDSNSVADNALVAGDVMRLTVANPVRALAEGSDEAPPGLQAAVAELLKELREGRADRALAGATETLPAMRALLAGLPGESLSDLIPVAVFISGSEVRVFVVPRKSPDFLMHLLFRRDGGSFERRRVDLVSYQETYEWRRLGSPEFRVGGDR